MLKVFFCSTVRLDVTTGCIATRGEMAPISTGVGILRSIKFGYPSRMGITGYPLLSTGVAPSGPAPGAKYCLPSVVVPAGTSDDVSPPPPPPPLPPPFTVESAAAA